MRIKIDVEQLQGLPPVERDAALKKLQSIRAKLKRNPLLGYNPWSAQWSFQTHSQRLRAFLGGNRAGKTTVGIADDVIQVTPREMVPQELWPVKRYDCPCFVRIINPSAKLSRSIIIPKLREWLPVALLKDERWAKSYSSQDGSLYLACGCRIDLMSYEMELDKFGGDALHRVHYDEEPPQEIRDESWARTLDYDGDEIFTMTPLKGLTWMYEEIVLAAEEKQEEIHIESASMLDNPYLPSNVRDRVWSMWGDSPDAQARVHGDFVHKAGLVYPDFHGQGRTGYTREWVKSVAEDIYVGIDPGVQYTGLIWAVFDQGNALHVIDAVKMQDVNVDGVASRIRERNDYWQIRDPQFVIDPAVGHREHSRGQRLEVEYQKEGIYAIWGDNDREVGVSTLRRRMANDAFFFNEDRCQDLVREARNYRILEREDGKFDVVKVHDHLMDALRYVAMMRVFDPPMKKAPGGHRNPELAWAPPKKQPKHSVMGIGA